MAFALTLLCASCTKEQKIDRLISQAEKALEISDSQKKAEKLAKIGEKLDTYQDADFTSEQLKKLEKISSAFMGY